MPLKSASKLEANRDGYQFLEYPSVISEDFPPHFLDHFWNLFWTKITTVLWILTRPKKSANNFGSRKNVPFSGPFWWHQFEKWHLYFGRSVFTIMYFYFPHFAAAQTARNRQGLLVLGKSKKKYTRIPPILCSNCCSKMRSRRTTKSQIPAKPCLLAI